MDYRQLNITGAVRIAPSFSLAETSAKLGAALGVTFKEDPLGTCDEFPSFSAKCAGLSFLLLGIPELAEQVTPEPITNYQVQIDMAF